MVTAPPVQINEGPVIEQVGTVFSATTTLRLLLHPEALVAVTEYVPAVFAEMHCVVAPVFHK